MSAEIARQPDPLASVGREFVALDQRRAWIIRLQVLLVWLTLIAVIIVVLLQLRFEPAYIAENYEVVLNGLVNTLKVSALSIVFASLLALVGSLGRLSKNAVAQGLSGFYVSAVRGTPLLIQIFLIYNGLPQIGQQLQATNIPVLDAIGTFLILPAFWSGVLALSLNYGAYMTEIFRAGMQSIGHGQREAALAMGMTRSQTLFRVILPQAIRVIIPDIGNQFIAMQKDSALVSIMGVQEITWWATRYARRDAKFLEMLLVAAVVYWILTIVSSWLLGYLENRLGHAYER